MDIKEKARLLTGKGSWHIYTAGGEVPDFMMSDGPHGLRKQDMESYADINKSAVATCFPTASAVASSWNTETAAKLARTLAKEAKQEGVSIVLGPGVNIKRSPLCGRNFEYFSEDPFLAGQMAAAYINSMESEGVGSSLKHFACNSQETQRQTSNSQMDEQAFFEIYLPAFENAVKNGKPSTVMASYNRIDGTYACANRHLLMDILRDKWGFDGVVVSDWGATMNIVECIKNGLDLEMPDSYGYHTKQLIEAYERGEITEAEIDRAAENVIRLAKRMDSLKVKNFKVDYDEHHRIAKEIEEDSAVLLKKGGVLPVKGNKVVVVGELAENMRYQGAGSSHITTIETMNAVKALENLGIDVLYAKGYEKDNERENKVLSTEAVKLVLENADVPVLFFGGLTERFESEGYDRKTLSMPANQLMLIDEICKVSSKVAFIAFGGSAFEMPFADKVNDILLMYLGGQAVGEACAELITGKVNPSGKLAESFPYSLEDVGCKNWFGRKSDDVEYREGIFVGYRYYDKFDRPVRFCFGHGLSYSEFEYSNLEISSEDVSENDKLQVTFTVTNTGECDGAEVVEIYVRNPECNLIRAKRELRGFKKVYLKAGESREVSITLGNRAFSMYDREMHEYIMPSGEYEVEIGASVSDIRLSKKINVKGITVLRNERELYPDYFDSNFDISKECFEKLYGKPLSHFDDIREGEYTILNSFGKVTSASKIGRRVHKWAVGLVNKMYKGEDNDPAKLMILSALDESPLDSLIGNSNGMLKPNLTESQVLLANGHKWKALGRLFKPSGKYAGKK